MDPVRTGGPKCGADPAPTVIPSSAPFGADGAAPESPVLRASTPVPARPRRIETLRTPPDDRPGRAGPQLGAAAGPGPRPHGSDAGLPADPSGGPPVGPPAGTERHGRRRGPGPGLAAGRSGGHLGHRSAPGAVRPRHRAGRSDHERALPDPLHRRAPVPELPIPRAPRRPARIVGGRRSPTDGVSLRTSGPRTGPDARRGGPAEPPTLEHPSRAHPPAAGSAGGRPPARLLRGAPARRPRRGREGARGESIECGRTPSPRDLPDPGRGVRLRPTAPLLRADGPGRAPG